MNERMNDGKREQNEKEQSPGNYEKNGEGYRGMPSSSLVITAAVIDAVVVLGL